jgi:hypothetical protein
MVAIGPMPGHPDQRPDQRTGEREADCRRRRDANQSRLSRAPPAQIRPDGIVNPSPE